MRPLFALAVLGAVCLGSCTGPGLEPPQAGDSRPGVVPAKGADGGTENTGSPGAARGTGGASAPMTSGPTPVVPDESEPPFDPGPDEDAGTP